MRRFYLSGIVILQNTCRVTLYLYCGMTISVHRGKWLSHTGKTNILPPYKPNSPTKAQPEVAPAAAETIVARLEAEPKPAPAVSSATKA